ncbi:MAG: chemotaxis protein CheC, partial [Planctomycetota bacterium]
MGEVVNIGVGRAAASLSELLGTRIELRVPQLRIMDAESGKETGLAILQSFEGAVSGKAVLAFPPQSGEQLARLLAGYEDDQPLPPIELSGILTEVGNIVLNGVLGSMSNIIQTDLAYSVPDFIVDQPLDSIVLETDASSRDAALVADTHFFVKSHDIYGSVLLGFEPSSECHTWTVPTVTSQNPYFIRR